MYNTKKLFGDINNPLELSNFSMLKDRLKQDVKEIKRNHFASIQKGEYKIKSGVIFNNMFTMLASIDENAQVIFDELQHSNIDN